MSHIEYLEGRRFALEMLSSIAGSSPVPPDTDDLIATVTQNLHQTAQGQPLAYANGIYSVLSKLPKESSNG